MLDEDSEHDVSMLEDEENDWRLECFPLKDRELYNSAHFASPYQPTLDLLELSSRNEPGPEDYSEREDGETELGAVEKTFLGDSTQNLSNEVLDDIIEVDGKTSQALHPSYR
jgi:hypothetical protein